MASLSLKGDELLDMSTARTVAVIGARGFVGQSLCSMLANQRFVSAVPLSRPLFDLNVPSTWEALPPGANCVIHAAAALRGDIYELFNTNALSAGPLATHLNSIGVRKLIFLSTGSVYGAISSATSPSTPCVPDTLYAASKYVAERKFAESFRGRLNVLRLYFPYGPNQPQSGFFPKMAMRIACGEVIQVNPDGGPLISISHIDDLCRAVIDNFVMKDNDNGICNLVSGHVVRMEDVARGIAARLGRDVSFRRDGKSNNIVSEAYREATWREFRAEDVELGGAV